MADITVQVSSAGLTAYGASSWGSQSFGGDQSTSTTVGSLNAFNNEGWGRLTWGSLVWNQDFESQIISVTTPGTPTTYGYESWGEFNWGQITGLGSDLGDEFAGASIEVLASSNLILTSVDVVEVIGGSLVEPNGFELNANVGDEFAGPLIEVIASTNLLNISVNNVSLAFDMNFPVSGVVANVSVAAMNFVAAPTTWGQNTWGYGGWGEEVPSVIGTADVSLSTNSLLDVIEGFTSENVLANTIVDLVSPGNLPWGATSWGSGSWGNIGGMYVSQGAEEEAVPSIEVDVTGNILTATLTSIAQVTGDANITPNTNLLTISLGDEDAIPNTFVELSTNLLNVSMGIASGEALTTASVTSVTATCQTGRLFITAWAVVDIGVTNNWSVVDIAA
jgi:hypothetical protein